MIRTNKKMRELYAKHLNKLYNYAKGNFKDGNCHLCTAANSHPESNPGDTIYIGDCYYCPLPGTTSTYNNGCNNLMRMQNLRGVDSGGAVWSYDKATPDSIRKHARWIEKQIVKNTDCEFYWK